MLKAIIQPFLKLPSFSEAQVTVSYNICFVIIKLNHNKKRLYRSFSSKKYVKKVNAIVKKFVQFVRKLRKTAGWS